jgi:hypothetical protein
MTERTERLTLVSWIHDSWNVTLCISLRFERLLRRPLRRERNPGGMSFTVRIKRNAQNSGFYYVK